MSEYDSQYEVSSSLFLLFIRLIYQFPPVWILFSLSFLI